MGRTMCNLCPTRLTLLVLVTLCFTYSPNSRAREKQPLRLVQTIPMPNVKGRIDHMDVDVKGKRLFVAGLENGSLEIVDLQAAKWLKSIPGFQKPQGIAYVESLNKVFVASGDDGMVRIFRGNTLDLVDSVKLDLGPNRVVYDPHAKLVYVGYGGADAKRRRLFVSALGNNSLEVIDVFAGRVIHSIKGLAEPQGPLYVPEVDKLYVANAEDGKVKVYDGATYTLRKAIDFGVDPDNMRYD